MSEKLRVYFQLANENKERNLQLIKVRACNIRYWMMRGDMNVWNYFQFSHCCVILRYSIKNKRKLLVFIANWSEVLKKMIFFSSLLFEIHSSASQWSIIACHMIMTWCVSVQSFESRQSVECKKIFFIYSIISLSKKNVNVLYTILALLFFMASPHIALLCKFSQLLMKHGIFIMYPAH